MSARRSAVIKSTWVPLGNERLDAGELALIVCWLDIGAAISRRRVPGAAFTITAIEWIWFALSGRMLPVFFKSTILSRAHQNAELG